MLTPESHRDRLEAAYQLLTEPVTTFETIERIKTLLAGINPKIDQALTTVSQEAAILHKIESGDIIDLTIEGLPANTPEEKRRKKALVFFITSWNQLKSEVDRVKTIYDEKGNDGKIKANEHASAFGQILTFAKGPLGLITVTAVAIVGVGAFLSSLPVSVTIKNQGCAAITPIAKLPFPIPGIKLPTENIPDGGEAIAKVPPLTIKVDGNNPGSIILSAFNLSMSYYLPGVNTDLIFDDQSLIGKETKVDLGNAKNHLLVISCE